MEISNIGDLRKVIEGLPDDRPIMFQVVATNGQAWNMRCHFVAEGNSLKWAAVLQLKHEDLARLADECFADTRGADE